MERKLSASERVIWLSDQVGCVNCVTIGHAEGDLDEHALRGALDLLARRHPLLRTRIESRGEAPFFVSGSVPRIPLRVVRRRDDVQWRAEVERELNDPIPTSRGPLVRAVLVKSGARSELLLVCHHVIADGKGSVNLFSEMLDLAGRPAAAGTPPEVEALSEDTPVEAMLPRHARGLGGLLRASSLVKKQLINALIQRPRKLPKDGDAPPARRRSRFIRGFLSPGETAALVARCREEHTTMQGAVCAAMLKAAAVQISGPRVGAGPVVVNCSSPVDLRPVLDRPIKDEMGNFASMVVTAHKVGPGTKFWELSRAVRADLRRAVERGEPAVSLALLDKFLPRKVAPEALVKRLGKVHSAMSASNLGVLAVPERFGAVTLRELHFALSTRAFPDNVVAVVSTHRGQLGINFCYTEPALSSARVAALAEETFRTLRHAAGPSAPSRGGETGPRAPVESLPENSRRSPATGGPAVVRRLPSPVRAPSGR